MRSEVSELSANPLPDIPCQTSRMKNLTITLCLTISVLLWTTMSIAKADSWVDEDGGAIVKVQDGIISIYSLNSSAVVAKNRRNHISLPLEENRPA